MSEVEGSEPGEVVLVDIWLNLHCAGMLRDAEAFRDMVLMAESLESCCDPETT